MDNKQLMINQVNAIISFLPEHERNILPKDFVSFFKTKATCPPHKAIDTEKSLGEQELADETLLMLYYINKILKDKKI